MPLKVTGKNMDVASRADARRQRVEAIIARTSTAKSGSCRDRPEARPNRADCALHLSSGMNLQAEGRAHEPYASFDQASDKIERRLRRLQQRLKNIMPPAARRRRRRPARGRQFRHEAPDEHRKRRLRTSARWSSPRARNPLKHLSVASAVAELDLTGRARRGVPTCDERSA